MRMGRVRLLLTGVIAISLSATAMADEATQAEFAAMNARIQRIERVVDNQVLLNMIQRMDALQREVRQLRGENERLAHELNALKKRQREQYLDIDRRLQASSGASGGANGQITGTTADTAATQGQQTTPDLDTLLLSSEPTSSEVTSDTAASTATSEDAKQDYKNAFILLKQGKYDQSINVFESFLQSYPDSEYAPNAQYWLAEANYVSRRYPQALVEFSKLIENYPISSKVADAKLKLGFTHYELEQYEEAYLELNRVRAQFPNSSVADLAQQRLERMLREGH